MHDLPRLRSVKVKYIRISGKDREHILSELSLLLKAGVPIGRAFESLRQTGRSRRLKAALDAMAKRVDEGLPLWQVLEKSGLLTPQALALVRLGEKSGNLVENLRVAAVQEEKQRSFRMKVYSALLYPVFVLGITLVVGLGVAWFLLPRLAETFAKMNVQLPLISQFFVSVGLFLGEYGNWIIPLLLGVISLIVYLLLFVRVIRTASQRVLLHVPGVSRMLHEVEIARFGYLLGTLLRAGLSITQSLELLAGATPLHPYRQFYLKLKESYEEGFGFRSSLPKYASTRILPPAVQQIIIAGEHSGALPETLLNVGAIYEDKADVAAQNLETILEPALLVIVWLAVLSVAVAVVLPVYSLVNTLGGQ